jgi:hypothetical protein
VSLLIEFLEAITNVMIGIEEGGRAGRIARSSDIEPFILRLDDIGAPQGMERCGEDSFCLGEAVLVYAVEPLLTPEGHGLADVAVRQLEAHGAAVQRIGQPREGVLSVAGSVVEGWLEARILASRGWVFLISAPSEQACGSMATVLDRAIVEIEGPSAR